VTRRLVALPDTDGEAALLLGRLEEVLLALAPVDDDDETPPGDLGQLAVEAVRNVGAAVRAAERGRHAPTFAADGTFELVPLIFADLDDRDVDRLGAAVAALSAALSPVGDERSREILSSFAGDPAQTTRLVAGFDRVLRLVNAAADADTWLLAARLVHAPGPVVLSGAEEAAYRRLTERALSVFHDNDPLIRFLYRGI
jgi:hypothetical protein